jgi:uncharacterized protein (DUF983 family)
MGGYIFNAGVLTLWVALTSFRRRDRGAAVVIALVGLTCIGSMVAVNFIIASDFKWLLLSFLLPWAAGLALYAWGKHGGG